MRQALESHLASHQVSRVVYGAVIGLALVVSLESHPPPPGVVVGALLATAVAVGLAELYSEVVGTETRTRKRVDRAALRRMRDDVAAVILGVAFPAVFFILAALGALEPATAFTVAKWSGLGLIAFYGFVAARLAGDDIGAAVLHALAVAAIGGVLIGVKALVH